MGHMSKAQITVLALWSFGIVLSKVCGMTKVTATLAEHFNAKERNLRQRLREWLWDKPDKKGAKRVEWDVYGSFAPLMKWVLTYWPKGEKRMALAIDATTLKDIFAVLSISVVYRSCAIPVAWVVLPLHKKGSWKPHWLQIFQSLKGSIPPDWFVIVLADRGLYAPWLYEAIRENGWHPYLRINIRSTYRPKGTIAFRPMAQLLDAPGDMWAGEVICFATNSIECTLLACWGSQHKEPWLILTDIHPDLASAVWYRLRGWIEDGFRDLKRDGWQWQKTRMVDPKRATRFWLALAVSTLWTVSVGGEADANLSVACLDHLPPTHVAHQTKSSCSSHRTLSCFARGLIVIANRLISQQSISLGRFFPEPWPTKTYP